MGKYVVNILRYLWVKNMRTGNRLFRYFPLITLFFYMFEDD